MRRIGVHAQQDGLDVGQVLLASSKKMVRKATGSPKVFAGWNMVPPPLLR